jgi:hypothetical protein
MLFELVLFVGGCHNGSCRLERPIVEKRVQKSVVVKVEKEVKTNVVRERKVRRFLRVR